MLQAQPARAATVAENLERRGQEVQVNAGLLGLPNLPIPSRHLETRAPVGQVDLGLFHGGALQSFQAASNGSQGGIDGHVAAPDHHYAVTHSISIAAAATGLEKLNGSGHPAKITAFERNVMGGCAGGHKDGVKGPGEFLEGVRRLARLDLDGGRFAPRAPGGRGGRQDPLCIS